jgi:starch synthase
VEIYHISAECYPVAKVGGLGDVVGALPKYQHLLQHKSKVVLPRYDNKFFTTHEFDIVYEGTFQLGEFNFSYSVVKEQKNILGFELYLIDIPGLFDRPNVYSYEDDTERFLSFQIAFLDWLIGTNQKPDVLHCHDHHTGLIPFMVKFAWAYKELNEIPTILTIHNAQYQGWFGFEKIHYLPYFDTINTGYLEWNGIINPLASAIKCASKVTTVSPSYLEELMSQANGLENLLSFERGKCIGILNGIDTELWNPSSDSMLEANFNLKNYNKGKEANKEALCKHFNLDPRLPLFSFIGRLVGEKGADLLPQMCSVALADHQGKIAILILGSGDPEVENSLKSMRNFYNGFYNVEIGYNEKLAHNMYAGSDFLLMPSRVEPCGLNQMYALRYGTIPIVRRTGGLKDTVVDIGDGGFGICHDQTSVFDVTHSITRAVQLFDDTKKYNDVRKTAMKIDHSWDTVAEAYNILYKSLKK